MKLGLVSMSVVYVVFSCLFAANVRALDPESVTGIWLFDAVDGNEVRDSSGNGHEGEILGKVKSVDGKFRLQNS